jgi:DNA processing protein
VEDRLAYIALNMMEHVGPVGVRSMRERLGSVAAILDAPADELMRADGVGPAMARHITEQRGRIFPQDELDRAARLDARILTPLDAEYPRALLEIHDPPLALYIRGSLTTGDRHAVAVIGTRRPTTYGREVAQRLSYQLAGAGFTVNSGLARGIDTCAHRGALKAGGRTVAVLGGALDSIYPPENEELAGEIARQGAVLSELPLGRKPDKTTFPMRNRIVSGMSRGVLVVEANSTSGALITARQAAEQGRSIFAVPGRIDSPASQGTHRLIRDGARLVEGVEDVLQEFEFLLPAAKHDMSAGSQRRPAASPDEQRILDLLGEEETDVDSVIRSSGLAPARVNALLIGLEMKKLLKMLPGRVVVRVR